MEAASIGTVYLIGEVVGALVFGRLSDQLGRRSLFMWTLAVYLVGTGLTALTPRGSGWIIYLFATRFIAGTGIGGEYSAINSAIDEMMPARCRGRTDVWINGAYWLGAIIGTRRKSAPPSTSNSATRPCKPSCAFRQDWPDA